MDKTAKREELAALLRSLSPADTAWLRQRLLRRDSVALLQDTGRISPQELLSVESWLWERAAAARGPREKRPRLRMWLIFMLLRYAGLRLVEIFALGPPDMDLQGGIIRVKGACGREVPLPLAVSRRLRRVLEDPGLFPASPELMRCDASYVRRSLQQCGAACGLPKGLLSARSLRHSRALELGRQGLPLPVVDIFLGRRAGPGQSGIVRCDPQKAQRLLREQLQRERPMKTSARNVFQGRIVALRQSGLLVEAILSTAGGLRVAALITDESYRSLALEEGKLVNASVKAPMGNDRSGRAGRRQRPRGRDVRRGKPLRRRGGTGARRRDGHGNPGGPARRQPDLRPAKQRSGHRRAAARRRQNHGAVQGLLRDPEPGLEAVSKSALLTSGGVIDAVFIRSGHAANG